MTEPLSDLRLHDFRTLHTACELIDQATQRIEELNAQLAKAHDPEIEARRDALLLARSDDLVWLSSQEPPSHVPFFRRAEPRDFWIELDAFLAEAERLGIKPEYNMPPTVSGWTLRHLAPGEGAIEFPQRFTMSGRQSEPMP
jgi:hypothetical protein